MGFTLKIKFVCLCFFVPDEDNDTVHVLMPATCKHGPESAEIEPHHVSLVYPFPGGRLDQYGHEALPGEERVKDYKEMTGWALTLGGRQGRAITTLHDEIVDVTDNAGPVDPKLLQDVQQPMVASHITLTAGSLESVHPAARWRYNHQDRAIAQYAWWTMDLPGDELTWTRTRLKPAGSQPADGDIEHLPPVPANGGVVELEVHHTTAAGFPIPRNPGDLDPDVIASHFAAFYSFFPNPANPELPVWLHDQGVSPRTCMGASGRLY